CVCVCSRARTYGVSLGFRICSESSGLGSALSILSESAPRGGCSPRQGLRRRDSPARRAATGGVSREGAGVSGRSPSPGLRATGRPGICKRVRSRGVQGDAVTATHSRYSAFLFLLLPFLFLFAAILQKLSRKPTQRSPNPSHQVGSFTPEYITIPAVGTEYPWQY
ncbi:hypothetical protein U0070_014817, partial [Myodes glareolus]